MFENGQFRSHEAVGNSKRQQPCLSILGAVLCVAVGDRLLESFPGKRLEFAPFLCAGSPGSFSAFIATLLACRASWARVMNSFVRRVRATRLLTPDDWVYAFSYSRLKWSLKMARSFFDTVTLSLRASSLRVASYTLGIRTMGLPFPGNFLHFLRGNYDIVRYGHYVHCNRRENRGHTKPGVFESAGHPPGRTGDAAGTTISFRKSAGAENGPPNMSTRKFPSTPFPLLTLIHVDTASARLRTRKAPARR